MSAIFWLREGRIAGRPGPDREPWDVGELVSANIRRVLSVNDGRLVHEPDLDAASIEYRAVPLSSDAPPQEGDEDRCLDALPEALKFVLKPMPAAGATLIHCSSGKDRTGMFLCYYLLKVEGLSPDAAVSEVRRIRPIALTAPGWEELTYAVLHRAAAMASGSS